MRESQKISSSTMSPQVAVEGVSVAFVLVASWKLIPFKMLAVPACKHMQATLRASDAVPDQAQDSPNIKDAASLCMAL